MGRKTTGLLNGGWVTEVISLRDNRPFFRMKEWAFLLSDVANYHNSWKREEVKKNEENRSCNNLRGIGRQHVSRTSNGKRWI